jgi:hypothetical protein
MNREDHFFSPWTVYRRIVPILMDFGKKLYRYEKFQDIGSLFSRTATNLSDQEYSISLFRSHRDSCFNKIEGLFNLLSMFGI